MKLFLLCLLLFSLLALCVQILEASSHHDPRTGKPLTHLPSSKVFFSDTYLIPNLLACIGDGSFNPALVCKNFAVAFKRIDMASELVKAGYPLLSNSSKSEMFEHFWLRGFIGERFSELLEDGSIFKPRSPQMVECAVKFMLGNLFKNNVALEGYFCDLRDHLFEIDPFSVIIHLYEILPVESKASLYLQNELLQHILYKHAQLDPYTVFSWYERLCKSMAPVPEGSLSAIFAVPIPAQILAQFVSECGISSKHVAYSIKLSCVLDFVEYTPEQQAMIYERNKELLTQCDKSSSDAVTETNPVTARLINTIRFSTDDEEVAANVSNFLENATVNSRSNDIDHLLAATVYSNRPDVFQMIWCKHQQDTISKYLAKAIRRHLSFMGFLSGNYTITSDPTILMHLASFDTLNHGIEFVNEKIKNIKTNFRLFLTSVVSSTDEFAAAVAVAISNINSSAAHDVLTGAIELLEDDHDNPVPFVTIILQQLRIVGNTKNLYLKEKYLRALLSQTTSEPDREAAFEELKQQKVHLAACLVHSLLTDTTLAAAVNSESNRRIVTCFCIPWHNLFADYSINIHQLLRIFQIFHLSNVNLSLSDPVDLDYMQHINTVFDEPIERIKDYANQSGFIMYFILFVASNDVRDKRFKKSVTWSRPNPFLLRSFHLSAWWMCRNPGHFAQYAPLSVVRAFIPDTALPPAPNPYSIEGFHQFESLCKEDFWRHAPEDVRTHLESFIHPNMSETTYPLRICNPFEQWHLRNRQSFWDNAPPQAIRAIYDKYRDDILKLLQNYDNNSANIQQHLKLLLKNQELNFMFFTQTEMDARLAQILPNVVEIIQSVNCRIHFALEFDRSITHTIGSNLESLHSPS